MRISFLALATAAALVLVLVAGCAVDPMESLSQNIGAQSMKTREQALLGLANLNDPRAVDVLVDVLQGANRHLSQMAAVALVKHGREVPAKKKPNPVVAQLDTVAANTHLLEGTRARACWTLGEIGDREAVPTLKGLLADTMVSVAAESKTALQKLGYYNEGQAYVLPWGSLAEPLTEITIPPSLGKIKTPPATTTLK